MSSTGHKAGLSVNALIDEIDTATEMVTTIPMACFGAKSMMVLRVKPTAASTAKVPISSMLVDCYSVFIPWRRTSSGSVGRAWETRFCTLTWARSASVPISKVTVSCSGRRCRTWRTCGSCARHG